MNIISGFGSMVMGDLMILIPLDQVNNYFFKVGANPAKLLEHDLVASPVNLLVQPIFLFFGGIAGAAAGGSVGGLLSLGHPIVALSGACVGALVGMLYAGFQGTIVSADIARDFIQDPDANAITKEQSHSLAKIKLYELAALAAIIASAALVSIAAAISRPRFNSGRNCAIIMGQVFCK
jgi:hypothetical protein